jgi:N-acetylglucosamine-6-phosphate deacetylase
LLALAPEFPENQWLIDECVRRGITVAAGHTTAGYDEMRHAVSRGLSQVTHCYNGMGGFNHRLLGTVGAALAIPEIDCELIADNIHVHPAAQKILVDVKGASRVILITDAIRAAGLPDGEYPMGERTVTLREGAVRLPNGSLAGSVLTMEHALRNVSAATGRPLEESWVMSSLNAARAIGIADHKGSLEPGKDADLALLDADCQVMLTVAEGQVVYEMGEMDSKRS